MITAKIIKDSISVDGIRLTTLHLRYPRMIHAEILTHRNFSRNGRSSRAVPVLTLMEEKPYTPYFKANKPGMVAGEEFTGWKQKSLQLQWKLLANITKLFVYGFAKQGVHKQWANRPLEWFGYIDVLVSSTEWNNFFALRIEDGAQPEIKELAEKVKEALDNSTPVELDVGDWHLPYITWNDFINASNYIHTNLIVDVEPLEIVKKISVARCARLTIRPFNGNSTIEAELARFDKLMVSRPVHASPAEHIATPDVYKSGPDHFWLNDHQHGNFTGWRQFRKMITDNTVY